MFGFFLFSAMSFSLIGPTKKNKEWRTTQKKGVTAPCRKRGKKAKAQRENVFSVHISSLELTQHNQPNLLFVCSFLNKKKKVRLSLSISQQKPPNKLKYRSLSLCYLCCLLPRKVTGIFHKIGFGSHLRTRYRGKLGKQPKKILSSCWTIFSYRRMVESDAIRRQTRGGESIHPKEGLRKHTIVHD